MAIELRAVRESELEETFELQQQIFRPTEAAVPRYRSYVEEDPSYRLHQTRVAVEDGRIVSHLRVWDRTIRVRGATLRAGGIGSLLTRPECRGRGYARALLADTERYFAEYGYDIGLLFTIIGTPYYASLGWVPVALPKFEVDVPDGVDTAGPSGVRRLNAATDLQAVSAIYDRATREMTGPEARDAAYWTSGPSRMRGLFPEWGLETAGRLVGYVNLETGPGAISVREACVLPAAGEAASGLAAWVLGRARGEGIRSIEGSLPVGHPFAASLAALTGRDVRWASHDKMMVKVADWESTLRKLGRPEGEPASADEAAFWREVFCLPDVSGTADPNGTSERRVFYWLTDIF